MNKSVILLAATLLLAMPFVAALDTEIIVTTHPSTWAMVRVFEANNPINLIQSFLDTEVGEDGTISFNLAAAESDLDIEVYIKLEKNGQSFVYKKFEDVRAGQPFNATVMKGNPQPEESTVAPTETATSENATNNATTPTTETLTETTGNESAPITGNAIIGELTQIKSYYIIVAVLAAGLIAGALFYARQRMRNNGTLGMSSQVVEKVSPVPAQQAQEQLTSDTLDGLKEELQKTKDRLQATTSDLAKMRNQDRIAKLEQNIKDEEIELRRLREESQN